MDAIKTRRQQEDEFVPGEDYDDDWEEYDAAMVALMERDKSLLWSQKGASKR